jgi:transposase
MYLRRIKGNKKTYIAIVKSERIDGKPRQKMLLNLGTEEELKKNNCLRNLILKLDEFVDSSMLLTEFRKDITQQTSSKIMGPPLVFDKLWSNLHIDSSIYTLSSDRKFEFNLERTIFAATLQRILDPSSDKALINWLANYQTVGCDGIQVQHCYRAMRWLGEPLDGEGADWEESVPEPADGAAEAAAPSGGKGKTEPKRAESVRTTKDLLEEEMFAKRSNLVTRTEYVFFDTTSVYFEGKGGEGLGKRGHSKNHRSDLRQAVVGAVMDMRGYPICTEIWPGNTADVTTLLPVAERLRTRFGIEQVCMVADRGMISKNTISELTRAGWGYILGVKMRTDVEVRDILEDESPFIEVIGQRAKKHDPAPLQVKEVFNKGNRYIICFNSEESENDKFTRQELLKKLENVLEHSNKALVSNKGYQKFIMSIKDAFKIDQDKVDKEAKYDGLYILRTNLMLDASQIALQYKRQMIVESLFRTFKSDFDTRPVYHQHSSNIRGHIWISFLAFLLKKSLLEEMNKLRKEGDPQPTWNTIKNDLLSLTTGIIQSGYKRFQMRSLAKPETILALRALKVKLPDNIIQLPNATELVSGQNDVALYLEEDK